MPKETSSGIFHRTIENPDGEGLTAEEVVNKVVRAGDSRSVLSGILFQIGLGREAVGEVLCGEYPDKRIEYSDDECKNWGPERRMRMFVSKEGDEAGIFNRLSAMSQGEIIKFKLPLPDSVMLCLQKYADAGFLEYQNSPERDEIDIILVKCIKEGGLYHQYAADSMVNIDYRLRGIGDIAREMQQICKEEGIQKNFTYLNIGNVPLFVNHPAFFIKTELETCFPGLHGKLSEGRGLDELTDREWEGLYNHLMSAYPPTSGEPEFIDCIIGQAEQRADACDIQNTLKGIDIIPTTGAADAIKCLRKVAAGTSRFLHVLPSYPVQTDIELAFAKRFDKDAGLIGSDLKLDKKNKSWKPDFENIKDQLEKSQLEPDPKKRIRFISIIHPSNPTGYVWSTEDLTRLFKLAEEFNAVVESDETYRRIVAPGSEFISAGVIASQLGLPAVIEESFSKDGLECGRKLGVSKFFNFDKDPRLGEIKQAFYNLQQESVGATSVQRIAPLIYRHPEYPAFIRGLNEKLFAAAKKTEEYFEGFEGVTCMPVQGGMYTSIIFDEGVLNPNQKMEIENKKLREFTEKKTRKPGLPFDERFLIYLMATRGIVASPLSGFGGKHLGFRLCNFEFDPEKNAANCKEIVSAIRDYLNSGKV